jgi:(1->4)-alpha-D-glucan 1-alpha-D-glucosylmutase
VNAAPVEPRATYRVQLVANFGLAQAAGLVDYLERLGVSHLYSSPVLQAAPGSTHGYDVVDHSRVSSELGGWQAFAVLTRRLSERGLGLLLDVVPNHMAIVTPQNRWWWDVLENGPSSRYAAYFDVDWDPPEARQRNQVLLPVLGDHYGRVLDTGALTVGREEGRFTVRYFDYTWPLAPRSVGGLLMAASERIASDDLAFIAGAYERLPASNATDVPAIRRRHRDKEVLRQHVDRLCRENGEICSAVDAELKAINADRDRLDALLDLQNYRLAFWRTAARDLGYRRFFDVNSLAGLRVETDRVFQDTHALVLQWLSEGHVHGLRIDHPDGLRDPRAYLERLQTAAPGTWVVVEKILEPGERLPESWPVAGSTGYDFMARVSALFVDPDGDWQLTDLYRELTGEPAEYQEVLREKKMQVLRDVLGSDLNRLANLFVNVCEHHRRHRDYTRHDLHDALREVIACFPVYRTYVRPEEAEVSVTDRAHIASAVSRARNQRPDIDPELFEFLRTVLLLEVRGAAEIELALRFQQVTGPAMAKGAEDTAFYCYHRLVSLNEVGGDPGRFGLSVDEFHAACRDAQRSAPRALLATSTHDSKRSEDVRARINLLSEIPEQWSATAKRWMKRNVRHWPGGNADRSAEYLFYQTLVGAWPIDATRMKAYMEKASREAKMRTSWTAPDAAYETALAAFVDNVLADREFVRGLQDFVDPLIAAGRVSSLSQMLLKLTTPGVPDIYQGTEVWDLSLVDPDNRRPVDYEARRKLLSSLEGVSPEGVMTRGDEGAPKMFTLWRTLHVRRQHPEAFGSASTYEPLSATGTRAGHVVAFTRGEQVAVVVPRLLLRLGRDWGSTTIALPEGRWTNVFTGEGVMGGALQASRLFARFPVSLLTRAGEVGRR